MAIQVLRREAVYLFYYLSLQTRLIAPYWAAGILLGSAVAVFGRERIHRAFESLGKGRWGAMGVVPASLLGIASPLCMYGTIPLVSSFSEKGMREDWLAAFMMSSMLLNPQLLAYSAVLGTRIFLFRFLFCFLGGAGAGLCVRLFFRERAFFTFPGTGEADSRDLHPNPVLRFLCNVRRNIKATGPYFLLGIVLTAVYQRYVSQAAVSEVFGEKVRGFGVLTAASLGVPLYVCGGGTIPLLAQWLQGGMSSGSAVAFMLTGPATKIANLSALKAALKTSRFFAYLGYVGVFAVGSGLLVDLLG